uniref:Uncharacterized protein n=1 Tax=Ditylenchus dipsaci TaxID=166011 RepID=A0A915ECJ5_9BILA
MLARAAGEAQDVQMQQEEDEPSLDLYADTLAPAAKLSTKTQPVVLQMEDAVVAANTAVLVGRLFNALSLKGSVKGGSAVQAIFSALLQVKAYLEKLNNDQSAATQLLSFAVNDCLYINSMT